MTPAPKFVPDWTKTGDVFVDRVGNEYRKPTPRGFNNANTQWPWWLYLGDGSSRCYTHAGTYHAFAKDGGHDFDLVRQYTPAAAPPEVPQWSEPMRYDVPQSNGCAGCPRLFVGTKWVGEICGAVYLGHDSVKYAERIVALWNDDIARHAPRPNPQPATATADEREANLSTKQVERMLAESWKIIKNAEGNALPASPPATVAASEESLTKEELDAVVELGMTPQQQASGVERYKVPDDYVGVVRHKGYGHVEVITAADHDRLLAERDGEIVELKQKLADEERRGDLHADLNKRVAEAVGNPFSGPGSSWHDLPEKVAALRTRAEAAEAKCAEYRDTFTAANEMRLSEVRLRHAVQQRAELAEMHCTAAVAKREAEIVLLADAAERESKTYQQYANAVVRIVMNLRKQNGGGA